MNGQWIEVFRAGTQTDSAGRTREWTESDLDHAAKSYNAAVHEAPVVVGHPKDNAPAYGWVEGLKREGKTLLAQFKQVAPEFAQAVKAGLYKKRSISLFADGRLRHVGFLGAAAPAVQGLKDIAFSSEEDIITIEFNERSTGMTVEELQEQLAAEKAKVAEFQAVAEKSRAELEAVRKETRTKEINDFIASGIEAGKILPAWKDQGLASFMLSLDEQPAEFQFSEAGEKKTQLQFFQDFMNTLAAHPLFKVMTKPADDNVADYSEPGKAAELILSFSNTKGA